MDDFELLHNDHALLSSHVVHVVALVNSLKKGSTAPVPLVAELSHQVELLHQQLREHFAFEEAQAFPQLRSTRPDIEPALEQLRQQHGSILQAFDKLLVSVHEAKPDWSVASVLSHTFESVFSEHAALEAKLFTKISGTPT